MADEADMTDPFITAAVDSGVEASRLKLLNKELIPMGACHYCTEPVNPSQLYCDGYCASEHAWELKRKKEIGR